MTQEALKAKADAYIGHPYELGEDADITSQREAYIKGCEDTKKDANHETHENLQNIKPYRQDLYAIIIGERIEKIREEQIKLIKQQEQQKKLMSNEEDSIQR